MKTGGCPHFHPGRPITPGQQQREGGWPAVLTRAPTTWETFRLVAG